MAKGKETPRELVYEAVVMRAGGASFTAVARKLGVGRRTVARIANDRLVDLYRLGLAHGARNGSESQAVGTSAAECS